MRAELTPARAITISPDGALAVLALGALVFVPVMGKLSVLVFLGAGGLLALRRPATTLSVCLRFWPVLLLPLYSMASALWSAYPAISLRFGLQLLITIGIAITIATRLSPETFCRALFALFATAMLASLLLGEVRGDTGAWLGIYGSKNALAGAAATCLVIATAQSLDRTASPILRMIALTGMALSLTMLILAQSVSALLVAPVGIAALLGLMLQHRLRPMQKVASLAFTTLLSALGTLLAVIYFTPLSALLLEATGKDLTLTGRTDLWRIAGNLIAERPFFGIGYQAFWVHGNPTAEALWAMFGIDGRAGFNFHNTYLSNAVEIGILGVAIQVFLLFGALIMSGLWALRERSTPAALLFALVLIVAVVSFVEVPVFFQFSLRSVIVICAFVYSARALATPRP